MKVKCINDAKNIDYKPNDNKIYFGDIEYGKIYVVISVEKDWFRVVDSSGEDYLYPSELFEIIEE